MEPLRIAHVATCWMYVGALALQFGAADGIGAIDLLLPLATLALVATALLGRFDWRHALLACAPVLLLALPVLQPPVAFLAAGYVCFVVGARAQATEPAQTLAHA